MVLEKTVSASGNIIDSVHENYQDVTGLGLVTGATYRASQTGHADLVTAGALVRTVVNVVHLIGQGQVPNFDLHSVAHITVNANGDLTASFSDMSSECP
jgi:hypothetical protein